jgi:hypothetical protein
LPQQAEGIEGDNVLIPFDPVGGILLNRHVADRIYGHARAPFFESSSAVRGDSIANFAECDKIHAQRLRMVRDCFLIRHRVEGVFVATD